MVDYNLRSKVDKTGQGRHADPRKRKKVKVNERSRKLKNKSHGKEVVHIDSDPDSEDITPSKPEIGIEISSRTDAWMEHPGSHIETDFYNFEKDRRRECFIKGQIWAVYDEYAMPRRYVQIDRISSSTNSVYVTFLKHTGSTQPGKKQNDEEMRWCRSVCGTFTPYSKGLHISRYAFSHVVYPQSMRRKGKWGHNIYPKKGDVWVIYKDASKMCSPRLQKYQLVEIISDYRKEYGVKAIYLVKYEGGYRSLFQRLVRDGAEVSIQIGRNQLDVLSHQVPSFRIEGESNTLVNGCFELDPSSLPLCIDSFTDKMEPKLNSKSLYLKFFDYRSLLMKQKFKENMVWATYDDRDGLPRSYAVIESVSGREGVNWLEPCPSVEDEKRWYKAGLPIACGNFRLKKTTITQDYSMFSHPMQYDWDHCSEQYIIYPRKGEVWGIYRDWEIGWSLNPRITREEFKFKFDFVEILEDFNKNKGARAVYLIKVSDFTCLFQRRRNVNGVEIPFSVSGNELYRFSHQIQDYKIQENSSIQKGSVVLDPLVVFQNVGEDSTLLEHPKEMDTENEKKDHNMFIPGQIWALYDGLDRMPRSYAIINKTFPDKLKVEMAMLRPHPIHEEEMEWVDKNLPIACGTFRVDKETIIKETSEFSHLVTPWEEGTKQTSFYKIIPQKGEVWAIYQDWDIKKKCFNSEEPPRYQMVEIIATFDKEFGVNVAYLNRVEGPGMVFERHSHDGFNLIKQYSMRELLQFSHQVPARIMGDGDGIIKGCWKLDSVGMPTKSRLLEGKLAA